MNNKIIALYKIKPDITSNHPRTGNNADIISTPLTETNNNAFIKNSYHESHIKDHRSLKFEQAKVFINILHVDGERAIFIDDTARFIHHDITFNEEVENIKILEDKIIVEINGDESWVITLANGIPNIIPV
jgi:hypothetical protein